MTHTPALLLITITSALVLAACRPAPSTPLTSAAFRGDAAQVKTLLATTSADTAADGWTLGGSSRPRRGHDAAA